MEKEGKYIPTDGEWNGADETMNNAQKAASERRDSAYQRAVDAGITPEQIPEIKFTETFEEGKRVWRGKVGDHEIVVKIAANNADNIEGTLNGNPVDKKTAREILSRYNHSLFDELGSLGYGGTKIEDDPHNNLLQQEKDLKDTL